MYYFFSARRRRCPDGKTRRAGIELDGRREQAAQQPGGGYLGPDLSTQSLLSAKKANIQYFIQYLFGDNWQIGMAPNILIDWKADQEDRFAVPVGLGVGKMVRIGRLPIKFTAEVDYMVVHPDDFGQRWGVRFQVIPVLPALIKDTLF